MLRENVAISCLLCCAAVLAMPQPNQLTFSSASIESLDSSLIGPNTNVAISADATALSWNVQLLQDLNNEGFKVTLDVKQQVQGAYIRILYVKDVPFCVAPTAVTKLYITLLGLGAATPPATCPFKAADYSLQDYKLPMSQLAGIATGESLVTFLFKYNNEAFCRTTLKINLQ